MSYLDKSKGLKIGRARSTFIKRYSIIGIFVCFFLVYFFYPFQASSLFYDLTCYNTPGTIIKSMANKFDISRKTIFFIETSSRGRIDSREACSVESAARANPKWRILVLVSGPLIADFMDSMLYKALIRLKNVRFLRIYVKDLVEGTPLENLISESVLDRSTYSVEHSSDVLRMLILHKYGGVYLDLDVMVMKSFDPLPENFLAQEDALGYYAANSIISLATYGIGAYFSNYALRDLAVNFDPSDWTSNGQDIVFRALLKICSAIDIRNMSSETCCARSVSHSITTLEMPRWADPRRDAVLRCSYERHPNDPVLHSVKWYRDTHEMFRYTPQDVGFETRAFNSSGLTIVNSTCDARECAVVVRPERGEAKYTCEVSSEGPRFAVDRRSKNMTLAVLPEYDPLVIGLPTMVQAGENAIINCTSDYSLPAATIDWFVDNEPQEDPLIVSKNHISGADGDGLQATWRTLHVFPDDYATHRGFLSLRCQATVATSPAHVRAMSVRLYVAARPHISSYMFSKNNAATSGSCIHRFRAEITFWTLVLVAKIKVPCV